jgi:glyoxylase-like metal-dependent hydrolase (beta-lactamase superfamily II)
LRLVLADDATLIHCPGHFPGSTILHWRHHGRDVVLAGDSLHVAGDRRHVSFVHSVPNHIPMHPDLVEEIRRRLVDLPIDDIYGFTWGLNILGDGRAALDASFDRHLQAVGRA